MTDEMKEKDPELQQQEDPALEQEAAQQESPQQEAGKKKGKDKKSEKATAEALAAATEEVKRLEQKLKDAQDAHLRTLAEYENYRKRTAKEKDSIYPDAICSTGRFLPSHSGRF